MVFKDGNRGARFENFFGAAPRVLFISSLLPVATAIMIIITE